MEVNENSWHYKLLKASKVDVQRLNSVSYYPVVSLILFLGISAALLLFMLAVAISWFLSLLIAISLALLVVLITNNQWLIAMSSPILLAIYFTIRGTKIWK